MAVTNLKVQLEFRMGPDGWSEQYFTTGSSPIGAKALAMELVNKRRGCLVTVATIHHVRISPANEQTIRSYRFPVPNGTGTTPARRDMGSATCVVGVYTESGHFRALKLHGSPDATIAYDADGNPSSALTSLIKTFMDYLAPGVAG